MSIIKIDGVEMPSPSSYSAVSSDIMGESGRNSAGNMQLDYITTKQKLELSWDILTDSQRQTIINAIKSPEHIEFNVTYIPVGGTSETMRCYKGDISAGICIIRDGKIYWKDFKVNFIEM